MNWYTLHDNQVRLTLHIKPNVRKTMLRKVDAAGIHIALHAKPHKGEANKELIAFLAELFDVPKSQIELLRGATGRTKVVALPMSKKLKEFLTTH